MKKQKLEQTKVEKSEVENYVEKINSIQWRLSNDKIISPEGVELKINAEVDGYFPGQIILSLIYEDCRFYYYASVDINENKILIDCYKNIKQSLINKKYSDREIFVNKFLKYYSL